MGDAAELAHLVEVQALDRDIARLQGQTETLPRSIEELEREVAASHARLEALRQAGAGQLKKRRNLEEELRTAQDKRDHILKGLHAIKSNREYTAAMNEIAAAKETVSQLEDALLELMEGMERGERELARGVREQSTVETGLRRQQEELRQELARVRQELEGLQAERARQVQTVSADLLGRYEKIRANKNGIAVVPLADGVCGGCSSRLPPQLGLDVRTGDEIRYCPHCGRILHAVGDKNGAPAPGES